MMQLRQNLKITTFLEEEILFIFSSSRRSNTNFTLTPTNVGPNVIHEGEDYGLKVSINI